MAIIRANTDVKVDGEICYVSCQNVKLTGKDRNKLKNERGPVVRSYLETKATFIQAAGIPENRYQPFRRKTSQCGGEKLSCGGIFFKKREKKIRFQDPTGKKF